MKVVHRSLISGGGLLIILLGILPCGNCMVNQQFGSIRRESSCERLNTNGKNYLMEYNTGDCYQFGTRGPCPEMMVFYADPVNPKFGFCDCDQGYKTNTPCNDFPVRKRIFSPTHNRCFSVFSQGPCRSGLWVTLSESGTLKCERNRCLRFGESSDTAQQFWYYDPQKKQCLQTLTQGYCEDQHTLEVVHDSQYPKCQKKLCFPTLVNGLRSSLTCAPGSKFSFLTQSCQKAITRRYTVG